jgi:putative effector of murein hydrolase
MTDSVSDILLALIWIGVSVGAYILSLKLYQKCHYHPLLHPLVGSTIGIIALLFLVDLDYQVYQQHVSFIAFMLGPVTVALAVPLYNQLHVLLRMGWRVIVPILVGGTIAPLLAWLSIYAFETPLNLQMTMLVKSITTPLAMGTAESIGGSASLAAVFVIITGIIGAIFAPWVFKLTSNQSHMAQGVALGTVAHAVGTSRAVTTSEVCAAFATLAVCLNGIVTAIVLPLLFSS